MYKKLRAPGYFPLAILLLVALFCISLSSSQQVFAAKTPPKSKQLTDQSGGNKGSVAVTTTVEQTITNLSPASAQSTSSGTATTATTSSSTAPVMSTGSSHSSSNGHQPPSPPGTNDDKKNDNDDDGDGDGEVKAKPKHDPSHPEYKHLQAVNALTAQVTTLASDTNTTPLEQTMQHMHAMLQGIKGAYITDSLHALIENLSQSLQNTITQLQMNTGALVNTQHGLSQTCQQLQQVFSELTSNVNTAKEQLAAAEQHTAQEHKKQIEELQRLLKQVKEELDKAIALQQRKINIISTQSFPSQASSESSSTTSVSEVLPGLTATLPTNSNFVNLHFSPNHYQNLDEITTAANNLLPALNNVPNIASEGRVTRAWRILTGRSPVSADDPATNLRFTLLQIQQFLMKLKTNTRAPHNFQLTAMLDNTGGRVKVILVLSLGNNQVTLGYWDLYEGSNNVALIPSTSILDNMSVPAMNASAIAIIDPAIYQQIIHALLSHQSLITTYADQLSSISKGANSHTSTHIYANIPFSIPSSIPDPIPSSQLLSCNQGNLPGEAQTNCLLESASNEQQVAASISIQADTKKTGTYKLSFAMPSRGGAKKSNVKTILDNVKQIDNFKRMFVILFIMGYSSLLNQHTFNQ